MNDDELVTILALLENMPESEYKIGPRDRIHKGIVIENNQKQVAIVFDYLTAKFFSLAKGIIQSLIREVIRLKKKLKEEELRKKAQSHIERENKVLRNSIKKMIFHSEPQIPNEPYLEALKFYANEKNYENIKMGTDLAQFVSSSRIMHDGGQKAREALQNLKQRNS